MQSSAPRDFVSGRERRASVNRLVGDAEAMPRPAEPARQTCWRRCGPLRGGWGRNDAGAAAVLAEAFVDHAAVDQREEREVAAHADVRAGVDARAALPDEDVAGAHLLARVDLDPAPLPLAVAPVAGAALTFLVRHYAISVTRTVVIVCRCPRRRR